MKRGVSAIEILLGIIFVAALLFVFFGNLQSRGPGIVVVDLHRVYQDLGRDLTDMQEMRKEQSALETRLQSLRENLRESISAKEKEFGENPTEEQKKLLSAMKKDAVLKVNQEISRNRNALQKYQTELIQEFRKEVKPIAEEIGAKQGATTVLVASPEVILSCDPSILITDEVVEAMQQPLQ
jgi:Skp family chaperone for outer membrane proteins